MKKNVMTATKMTRMGATSAQRSQGGTALLGRKALRPAPDSASSTGQSRKESSVMMTMRSPETGAISAKSKKAGNVSSLKV